MMVRAGIVGSDVRGFRVGVVGLGRTVVSWLLVVAVLAGLLVGVPLAPPVGAAPGDDCDSDGDGVVDGVEDLVVTNGRDGEADDLLDRFDLDVGSIEDPDRWFVTVCVGNEDLVLDGPTRGLSPNAEAWEDEARVLALSEARKDFWRPYPWMMPDHGGLQTVNAETWLAVDPVVYQSANRRIVASAEVYGVEVTLTADAVGAEFVFSDLDDPVVCPIDRNIVYQAALLPDVPCGREWAEPSERGEVSFQVGIQYEYTWESSLGGGSDVPVAVVSNPLSEFDLEVTEIQAFLSEDGAVVPPVPNFGRLDSIREGDEGCFNFWIVPKPDCLTDFVVEQILDALPDEVRAVIETVVDFVEGCVEYGVDAVGEIWAALGQVVEFARDPDAFVNEKWVQAQQMYNALVDDPEAFVTELTAAVGESELRTDLLDDGKYAEWGGYMGCKAIVAFLTGGGSSSRLVLGIQDVINKKFGGVELPPRKPGDDRNNDGDGDNNTDGPSCRTNSFPAGTLVLMADGSRTPIESVEPGDRVVTYNTETGVWSDNVVLDQWSGVHTDRMVTVTLSDGSAVSSTDDHLFWVSAASGEWIEADRLQPGDLLLTPDGVTAIAEVTIHKPKQSVVWELDTAIDDTFAVGTGADFVVVHNQPLLCDQDEDGNIRIVNQDGSEVRYNAADGTTDYVSPDGFVYENVLTDSNGLPVIKQNAPIYKFEDESGVPVGGISRNSPHLTKQADGTFVSSEGLIYSDDRIDHVLQHSLDKPDRTADGGHGVFVDDPFEAVDDAWAKALEEGIIPDQGGARYDVPMDEAGLVGGVDGAAAGNPIATHVRIIVRPGTNPPEIITAYPVIP